MKWMQNRDSVEIILDKYWPKVVKKHPQAQLFIIGRHAPDFYGKYSSKNIIVAEADMEGGPKDPQYYYEYCWLLLAPMASGEALETNF